jgi:hypothetical protein
MTKLKKNPADVDTYKKEIQEFNDRLTEAVKKWWKFTEKYEFHTMLEINKIAKGKTAKGYLVYQYLMQTDKPKTGAPTAASQNVSATLPFKKLSTPENFGCFEVRTAENLAPGKLPLAVVPLTFQAPSLAEAASAIQIVQYDLYNHMEGLNETDIKKNLVANAKNLLSKTLLIDKYDIAENEFTDSKIKKLYPYDYQIDEPDTLTAKIMEASPDYAYVKIVPTEEGRLMHYVISCEDGTVCNSYLGKWDEKMRRKERINAEALKAYGKNIK